MKDPGRKPQPVGRFRAFFGNILTVLSVDLTVLVTADMLYRLSTSANKDPCRSMMIFIEIICAVLVLTAVDIRSGFLTRVRFKPVKIAGIVIRTALALMTGVVLTLGGWTVMNGTISNAGDADSVILLGMALENGLPNSDLMQRVGTAARYASEHPGCQVIVTGGNPSEGERSEAQVMKQLLEQQGIEEERIVVEDKAADTRENFVNAAKLTDPLKPTVIVTSSYHMGRAVSIALDAGFASVTRLPSPAEPAPYCTNLLWEIVAQANRIIFGA